MTVRPYTTQLDIYDAIQRAPSVIGSDINEADIPRLAAQQERIHRFILDGRRYTLRQISEATGAPEASVSAQLRHLRRQGHVIAKEHVRDGLYLYRLVTEVKP